MVENRFRRTAALAVSVLMLISAAVSAQSPASVSNVLSGLVPQPQNCFRTYLTNKIGTGYWDLDSSSVPLVIKNFIGDGATDNTKLIQAAIDSCYNSGGGIVEFTNGTYLTGPVLLKSNVTLQIDSSATLSATSNMKAYYPTGSDTSGPLPSSLQPLIASTTNSTNLTITGKGTVEGNGQPWWTAYNSGTISVRPRLVQLSHSRNVLIENVTLRDSPQFHVSLQYCWNVLVRNVTILAPASSPNTDGIDPATCHFVQILNCTINTGDDNIAVKSGNSDATDPNAGSSNIFVSGCTFLHGHGVSIGSETNGGVDSMVVTNCTFDSTDNGLRIKSYRGVGGNVRNLMYTNIRMTNVKHPIWFSAYYPNIPTQTDPAQVVTTTTPYYHDIIIDSLIAVGGSTSNPGCVVVGVPEVPLTNIGLKNVNISGKYGLELRNAAVDTMNTTISATTGPPIIFEVNGILTDVVNNSNSSTVRSYSLSQNYPNPFNPTTMIEFGVITEGYAIVRVFNLLGQEVARPFNGLTKAGGKYRITFDGSHFASGVFFYSLESNGQRIVKCMNLIK